MRERTEAVLYMTLKPLIWLFGVDNISDVMLKGNIYSIFRSFVLFVIHLVSIVSFAIISSYVSNVNSAFLLSAFILQWIGMVYLTRCLLKRVV